MPRNVTARCRCKPPGHRLHFRVMDTSIAQLGPCCIPSPLGMSAVPGDMDGDYTPETARVRYQVRYGTGCDLPAEISFEAAGPRQSIYFDPARTRAAIVTCGGICPGMNNVIRSAFLELWRARGLWFVLRVCGAEPGVRVCAGAAVA
jgi:6-phosphofructokinase 1